MPFSIPSTSIVLLPVQSAPLPYQFRFTVQVSSTIPKQDLVITRSMAPGEQWNLADQDVLETCGFSKLTRQLLHHARVHNLWGQTIQVRANYKQSGGGGLIQAANQSAPQPLTFPASPILINSPNKIAGVGAAPYSAVSPPQGLRLFWAQLPATLTHNAWFVGADNRLSSLTAVPGFDRFSFWISALGLPIKSSAGVQTGEAFAAALKAIRLPQGVNTPQLSVADIVAAVNANAYAFDDCIFWNSARLLFFAPSSVAPGFREYGSSGLVQVSLSAFAAGQPPSSLWNVRLFPKQAAAWGLASVA